MTFFFFFFLMIYWVRKKSSFWWEHFNSVKKKYDEVKKSHLLSQFSNPNSKFRKIACLYIQSWFILDVLSAIPFGIFRVLMQSSDSNQLKKLRLLKSTRLIRLNRLLRFQNMSEVAHVGKMVVIMVFFVCVSHWVSCFFYFLGDYQLDQGVSSWLTTPTNRFILSSSTATQYWASNYLALEILMNGSVELQTNAERVFDSSMRIVGAFVSAIVFGQMAVQMKNLARPRTRYQEKLDSMNEIMHNLDLNKSLQHRIRNFHEYTWSRTKCLSHSLLYDEISPPLRSEVALYIHGTMIQSVPVFRNVGGNFLVVSS